MVRYIPFAAWYILWKRMVYGSLTCFLCKLRFDYTKELEPIPQQLSACPL